MDWELLRGCYLEHIPQRLLRGNAERSGSPAASLAADAQADATYPRIATFPLGSHHGGDKLRDKIDTGRHLSPAHS